MKKFITQLQTRIGGSRVRLWHVLALLTIFWLVPLVFPSDFFARNIGFILIVWAVLYIALTKLLPKALRDTTVDVLLIERFCVVLSFVVPLIYNIMTGLNNGFDGLTTALTVLCAVGAAALAFSIVLHIKKAPEYYHGVKKNGSV